MSMLTSIQTAMIIALALLGLAMLISVGLLAQTYRQYRRDRNTQQSLLKRLDNNPMLKAARPRRKYLNVWSNKT